MNNSWVCVHVDMPESFELARVQNRKITQSDGNILYEYYIITYYDGKELFTGSKMACDKWIRDHYVDRRYLDCYGKN